MKKMLLPLCAAAFLFACSSNENAVVKGTADSTAKTEPVSLPYKVAKTPDWETGDPAHVAVAMNTLKAYVDNNMAGIGQYLADSVEFFADDVVFRGSRDSLIKFFTAHRMTEDSIGINMHDYESVKSKARGEEWVSLWYVETDVHKGVVDSAMVMDDIRIVNGKVSVIDSKGRRLPKK